MPDGLKRAADDMVKRSRPEPDVADWSVHDPKRSWSGSSFDHLGGAREQYRRDVEADCFGSIETQGRA
jgi:hypothetical protein